MRSAGWTPLTWPQPACLFLFDAGIHECDSGDGFSEPQSILSDGDLIQATELRAIGYNGEGKKKTGGETSG